MSTTTDEQTNRQAADDLSDLLSEFAASTASVSKAIVVSGDGFLLAASAGHGTEGIEQLAAIISGLNSLTHGAADLYQFDEVRQVIVEMAGGLLFVMAIGDGSAVAAIADAECDLGVIGYEMTLLVDRIAALLTPDVIGRLKNTLSLP